MSVRVRHTRPGEGARLPMIDGVHIVKVSAEDTGGIYEMFEVEAPSGPAAPPHRSPWAATLYLLEGTVSVQVEGHGYDLTPGDTLTIPARAANTFSVTSDAARFLAFTTGDGAGKLFADFARTVPTDRPLEEIMPLLLAVTQRNAVTFAEPTG